jgi:hypothetical protein
VGAIATTATARPPRATAEVWSAVTAAIIRATAASVEPAVRVNRGVDPARSIPAAHALPPAMSAQKILVPSTANEESMCRSSNGIADDQPEMTDSTPT